MTFETTPPIITDDVRALCRDIDASNAPQYVPVEADPTAIVADCFFNVFDRVRERGGAVQYGWIIWVLPRVVFTAEFHAVWRDGDRLLDITPKPDGERTILFLCDSNRKYEYRPRNSIRRRLSNNGAVQALCNLRDRQFAIMAPHFVYPAKKGHADYALPPTAEAEVIDIERKITRLNRDIQRLATGRRG